MAMHTQWLFLTRENCLPGAQTSTDNWVRVAKPMPLCQSRSEPTSEGKSQVFNFERIFYSVLVWREVEAYIPTVLVPAAEF